MGVSSSASTVVASCSNASTASTSVVNGCLGSTSSSALIATCPASAASVTIIRNIHDMRKDSDKNKKKICLNCGKRCNGECLYTNQS